MEFQDVVRKRKMVRSFEPKPVPPEVLERVLANARRAPSAGHSQGWAFLVLEGQRQTAKFWDLVLSGEERARFGWPKLFDAPVVVVCLSEKDVYLARYAEPDKGWSDRSESRWPVPFWDIDSAMAAMLILLTAVDAGLGALFFGIRRVSEFRAAFGVPERVTPIGAVALGYPAGADRPSPSLRRGKRDPQQVVHRGRW